MDKKIFSYIIFVLFLISQKTFANADYKYTNPSLNTKTNSLQGYTVYVPSGTKVSAILSQDINSKTATIGQNINAILTEDFVYNGQMIASSGSVVSGSVVSNIKSATGGKNAQMQIRFTTIRTPYNNVIPISALILTDDLTGILKADTGKDSKKEYIESTVVTTVAVPTVAATGSLSRSRNKNVTYKTVIKKNTEAAKVTAAKGKDIKIPSSSQINIIFDQPITLGVQ